MTEDEVIFKIHEICKKYCNTFMWANENNRSISAIDRRIKFGNKVESEAKKEIPIDFYKYKYQLDMIVGIYNNEIADSFENK